MILGVSYHGSHLSEHMDVDMRRMKDAGGRGTNEASDNLDLVWQTVERLYGKISKKT